MSNSVRPHRWQPSRLCRPWDSPGKNTGVGCHFLLQCMKVKSKSEVAQSCLTLRDPMDCSLPGSSVHGIFQARVLEWVAIAFSYGKARSTNYCVYINIYVCVCVCMYVRMQRACPRDHHLIELTEQDVGLNGTIVYCLWACLLLLCMILLLSNPAWFCS